MNNEHRRNRICESLQGHSNELSQIKRQSKTELKSVVLTNRTLELHDKIEWTMKDLKQFYKENRKLFPEELPILSLQTLLPDLAIGAVLWCKNNELVNGIVSVMESLKNIIKCVQDEPKRGIKRHARNFRKRFSNLRKTIREAKPKGSVSELQRNHDFLSQQVDVRSSQVFTMGPLFVPISFLIFVYAVTSKDPYYLGGVPLMFASLSCYFVWFIMYLRTVGLNRLSYPLIHSLELMLGLSTHSSLFEIREKRWLLRIRQQVFFTALYVLITLWLLFIVRPTEIWTPSTTEFWNSPVYLALASLSLAFVFSLLWVPSITKRNLLVPSALFGVWTSIILTRLCPSFLVALKQLNIELLKWISLIWLGWFVLFFGLVKLKQLLRRIRLQLRGNQ